MGNLHYLQLLQSDPDQFLDREIRFSVTGNSMSPFINVGDSIYVKRTSSQSFVNGDILVVIRKDDIVTHRLVAITPVGLVCKGDNTHVPDPTILPGQVFGKVVAIERKEQRIELTNSYWKFKSRFIGFFSKFEYRLYSLAVPRKQGVLETNGNNSTVSLGRIVFSPFRAIMRLLSL